MYTDIYEDHLSMVRLFGQEVLVSDDTVPRNIVPDGWNCYDLQGIAEDPWHPVTLVREDDRYHCGTVLSPSRCWRMGSSRGRSIISLKIRKKK